MNSHKIIIFTDGSSSGNPGPGGWGAIVAFTDNVKELGGHEEMTTNNRMELKAAIEALKMIGSVAGDVVVHTDSSYVMQGITKWVKGWSAQNWLTANKKAVLNKDLWQELMAVAQKRERFGEIIWKLVEGHAGVPGNERVDVIATAFTHKQKMELYDGPQPQYTVNLLVLAANRMKKIVKEKKRSRSNGPAFSYVSMVNGNIETDKTWKECEARVKGKPARFKKSFSKEEEGEIIAEFKNSL